MKKCTCIGVIGCGNISDAYFNALPSFPHVRLKAASDLLPERSKAKAERYGFRAMTTEELLADPEIELVINLTTPEFHTAVNMRILEAGKHAYTEKPFGLDREAGRKVLELAAEKGLQTGGAPDTFLGGAHQTCRAAGSTPARSGAWSPEPRHAVPRSRELAPRSGVLLPGAAAGRSSTWVPII